MLTHVVMFALRDRAERTETQRRLQALPAQIPQILSMRTGLDVVGADGAADVVLITTHEDVAGLKAYQAHPVHREFVSWLGPRLANKAVVDFES